MQKLTSDSILCAQFVPDRFIELQMQTQEYEKCILSKRNLSNYSPKILELVSSFLLFTSFNAFFYFYSFFRYLILSK